jgi:hypothetical protein
LVIRDAAGGIDITSPEHQKILDPLASSLNVYLEIDGELKLLSYKQINAHEVLEPTEYKFNPDFVQQFNSILGEKDIAIHLTSRGDLLIQMKYGVLVSLRKGKWHIYDVSTFKNSITDILDDYRVGCNLFDIVFDLSYRRHGALLVFDPFKTVIREVVNKESVLENRYGGNPDPIRSALSAVIKDIKMGSKDYKERKKKLFLEIAGIDGAVIFDQTQVLAFGAMIKTHKDAGGFAGARTTAAKSAQLYGGTPVKISSDGDISLFFNSQSGKSNKYCDAELRFM